MKKRYEVTGMMEWHPVFKVGRSHLQVSFTGGNLCGGASSPAAFETADPVVQKVIESSGYYKSKRIRLSRTWGEPPAKEEPKKPRCLEYNSVDDLQEHLHYDYKIPLSLLQGEEACLREAAKRDIQLVKKPPLKTED